MRPRLILALLLASALPRPALACDPGELDSTLLPLLMDWESLVVPGTPGVDVLNDQTGGCFPLTGCASAPLEVLLAASETELSVAGLLDLVRGYAGDPDNPTGAASFRGACVEHQRCYATGDRGQQVCDDELQLDLLAACSGVADPSAQADCEAWASVYRISRDSCLATDFTDLVLAGSECFISRGADFPRAMQWRQGQLPGLPELGDRFGSALAAGDFDGDGADDLLVGAPSEDLGAFDAGSVSTLWGGAGDAFLSPGDDLELGDSPALDRRLGAALVAADFDGDGIDDAAVGAPGWGGGGAVLIGYGDSSSPFDSSEIWHQDLLLDETEEGDEFGSVLAAGDFDGDGLMDLAVGVPGEEVDGQPGAGAVAILYGDALGLGSGRADQLWSQGSGGLVGFPELGDGFGGALAAGDFDGDGVDDLAIGVPGEGIRGADAAGAVQVLYGAAGLGLDATRAEVWHRASSGIRGRPDDGEAFGSALAAGDFDGDGYDDIAVGVPGQNGPKGRGNPGSGATQLLRGALGGITAAGDDIFLGFSPGDRRGEVLGVLSRPGSDVLLHGIPGSSLPSGVAGAGAVFLTGTGIGRPLLFAGDAAIPGASEIGDGFGGAVAAGDFDGDGAPDIAIGNPDEDLVGVEDAGSIIVLHIPGGW